MSGHCCEGEDLQITLFMEMHMQDLGGREL